MSDGIGKPFLREFFRLVLEAIAAPAKRLYSMLSTMRLLLRGKSSVAG